MLNAPRSSTKTAIVGLLLSAVLSLTAVAGEGPDVKPTPVKTPPPSYPIDLRRDGVTGMVALRVEIDEQGSVTSCTVTKSTNAGFEAPALQAVRNWKFKPAQKDGVPVKTALVLPITFSLD